MSAKHTCIDSLCNRELNYTLVIEAPVLVGTEIHAK